MDIVKDDTTSEIYEIDYIEACRVKETLAQYYRIWLTLQYPEEFNEHKKVADQDANISKALFVKLELKFITLSLF